MRKKILIVEDDRKIALALGVRLQANGYEVLQAFDGLQGFVQATKSRPDAVVLDLSMPAGGGLSVAQRMRETIALASTPIVFMTASKRTDLLESAKHFGALAILQKPFEADELLGVLRTALGDDGVAAPTRPS